MILLEIIETDDPAAYFSAMDLENIEPFTLILFQYGNLFELRWDGINKHEKSLDRYRNYIWSSSTLYTDDVIQNRESLFEQFINREKNITPQLIRDLHGDDHGDAENGFVIDRQTGMKTFSITQAVVEVDSIKFLHSDLLQQQQFEEIMHIKPAKAHREEI